MALKPTYKWSIPRDSCGLFFCLFQKGKKKNLFHLRMLQPRSLMKETPQVKQKRLFPHRVDIVVSGFLHMISSCNGLSVFWNNYPKYWPQKSWDGRYLVMSFERSMHYWSNTATPLELLQKPKLRDQALAPDSRSWLAGREGEEEFMKLVVKVAILPIEFNPKHYIFIFNMLHSSLVLSTRPNPTQKGTFL